MLEIFRIIEWATYLGRTHVTLVKLMIHRTSNSIIYMHGQEENLPTGPVAMETGNQSRAFSALNPKPKMTRWTLRGCYWKTNSTISRTKCSISYSSCSQSHCPKYNHGITSRCLTWPHWVILVAPVFTLVQCPQDWEAIDFRTEDACELDWFRREYSSQGLLRYFMQLSKRRKEILSPLKICRTPSETPQC